MNHEGQYEYEVREDGQRIDGRIIDDPFVRTHIDFHLSRVDALKAVFRPLVKRFEVRVKGTEAADRVVFSGDYTPPERGEPVIAGEVRARATERGEAGVE